MTKHPTVFTPFILNMNAAWVLKGQNVQSSQKRATLSIGNRFDPFTFIVASNHSQCPSDADLCNLRHIQGIQIKYGFNMDSIFKSLQLTAT